MSWDLFAERNAMTKKKKLSHFSGNRIEDFRYQKLEPRNLLASISLTNGELVIGGGTGDDVASVSSSGSQVTASLTGVESETFALSDVDSIAFIGLAGDDVFTNERQ